MPRFSSLGLYSAMMASGACSLLNAPADVIPGTGGGTTSTSSTSTTSTSTTGTGGAGPCSTAADCQASREPCMQPACSMGACGLVPLPEMTPCDNGLFCSTGDACVAGVCKGTLRSCPSTDPCNPGSCDEAAKACATTAGNDGAACDDGNPCDQPGTCKSGSCTRGADACALLATDCVSAICTSTGCVTTNMPDDTPCGGFCGTGSCTAGHCDIFNLTNDGQACDDGLFCTVEDTCIMGACVGIPNPCATGNACIQGTCDEAAQQCVSTPIEDGAPCDDGDACTAGAVCSNQQCAGGGPPSVYFTETFFMPDPGWARGPEWQIGVAKACSATVGYGDPGHDYTGDKMLAGADIGALVDVSQLHPLYYLTSPVVSTDFAGSVYLTFYRWLNSDYQPFMQDTIEVSSDGGATWTVVWENPADSPINDDAWTFQSIDVTAYKGPTTQVRWGFAIGAFGVYDESGWNLDDVKLQNAPCPM